MSKTFREFHLFKALNSFTLTSGSLDRHLNKYFRKHKAIGSKDRKFINEKIYELIRWMGLIDHFCKSPINWEKRYQILNRVNLKKHLKDPKIPLHVRASFPKDFFNYLHKAFGEEKALELCHICNDRAPITIRTNVLKTTRRKLFGQWNKKYPINQTKTSIWGINFEDTLNFHLLEEFKQGHFEIQDEASQLVANLVEASPGDSILDYCAGSGGKSLAFAHKMQGKGTLFLHDIRPHVLKQAQKRIKRSGVENAQILSYDSSEKRSLRGKMDWVLVDVPCSGSGTLRRNPDLKWKFSQNRLKELVHTQRKIFEEALEFLKPEGKIVYATCSILPEENEEQAAYFQENYHLDQASTPFSSLPIRGGMDGFYGAIFQRLYN